MEYVPMSPWQELDPPTLLCPGDTHSLWSPQAHSAQHSCLQWRVEAECLSQGHMQCHDGTSAGRATGASCL